MVRAAIYVRQSLDRTGERAAVQRQLEACQALCTAKGWEIHGEPYEDNDTSATSTKPRKNYQRLLADAKAGRFEAIAVYHLDRLCRRVRDLEDVLDLGLPIATAVGDMDLSTDMGRLVARILGAVAQGEVERKGARQRDSNRKRAAAGVPHASPRPFGYRREVVRNEAGKVVSATLKVEPDEAKAVRKAYKRLLAGASLRSIATEWNAAGFLTSKGQPWAPYSVRDRLTNPLYAGLVFYNGEQVTEGNWRALVKEETWRAAVTLVEQPERRTTPGSARRYLLSGLARCGVAGCGAKMATGRTQHGTRTYNCSTSKHLSRAAEPIDNLVTTLVIARLSRPDASELLHDDQATPDYDDLREQAQVLRAREIVAADAYAEGRMSLVAFERIAARLRQNIATVEASMLVSADAEALRGLVGRNVSRVWEELDVDRRHAVVDALVTVTILPAGRGRRVFDPETVSVEWKRS